MLNYACEAGDGYTASVRRRRRTEKASRTVELRNRRRRWPTSGDQRVTLWWRRAPACVVHTCE